MSIAANYWAAKSWDITLLTFDNGVSRPFYDLDNRVRHIALDLMNDSKTLTASVISNVRRLFVLREAIKDSRPEALISFVDKTNIMTLLASCWLSVPVLVSERMDPVKYPIGPIWERLRLLTYPLASSLVVQSERALSYFPPKIQSRAHVIPNPVLACSSKCETLQSQRISKPFVMAIGRLVPQKGFDILLQSFARVRETYPDWSLIIVGEGPLRGQLEALRDKLGLEGGVCFPGRIKAIHEILNHADLFVMSSRFEGFPNALCEAMACGLPVISTDCPSGPREIITSGVDGMLIPSEDTDSLTCAMNRLMSDETERRRLAFNAKDITSRFNLERIMSNWEDVLAEVR